MTRSSCYISLLGFIILLAACTPATPSPPTNLPALQTLTIPTPTPDLPLLLETIDFALPPGNSYRPVAMTVDSAYRRLYTLNQGNPADNGNTLSALNLNSGRFIDRLSLNNRTDTDQPYPHSLTLDPYRRQLYALTEQAEGHVLHIVDLQTEQVRHTLSEVQGFAVGAEQLYLANSRQLRAVDPTKLTNLGHVTLDLGQIDQMVLSTASLQRLYLRRQNPGAVYGFDAKTLEPVGVYETIGEVLRVEVDNANKRLLVIERGPGQTLLHALDLDTRPISQPPLISLAQQYGNPVSTIADNTLYLSDGEFGTYTLRGYTLPDLDPALILPIPALLNAITADPQTGLLYLLYGDNALLKLDLTTGASQPIFTTQTINTALTDASSNRLYLLSDQGRLQVLSLPDYQEIAQFSLSGQTEFGFGQPFRNLALDTNRQRLYIGGDPVYILNTDSLTLREFSDLRGHITPDPASNRVYFTPPCQCRMTVCNTLILNARTMTGTQTLFPTQDPLSAPCVVATQLDAANQHLLAQIYNGVPGSNSGNYFTLFDVAGPPAAGYTAGQISYGAATFDPAGERAFVPRWRGGMGAIHRLAYGGGGITETGVLLGAQGGLAYHPATDRLYAVNDTRLLVLDGELSLRAEVTLTRPASLLTLDPANERLYLKQGDSHLLVLATGGGQPSPPPDPNPPVQGDPYLKRYIVPGESGQGTIHFRLFGRQLYRAQAGQGWQILGRGLPPHPISTLAISPDFARDQTLLVGFGFGPIRAGIYRSTDGGQSWTPASHGLTDLGVSQIAISPTYSRDQTLFASTQSGELFRSTDGGDHWEILPSDPEARPSVGQLTGLALSPNFAADGLLFIGQDTLHRSTDGGLTWTETHIPTGQVAFSPNFATDGLILSDGRWRSTDSGRTWQTAATGLAESLTGVRRIQFSPNFATDQTVYLLLDQGYDNLPLLHRSIDGGQRWQTLLSDLGGAVDFVSLPNDRLLLVSTDGNERTVTAQALTWGQPPVDLAALDLQALAVKPDGTLLVANSAAGVFASTDGGTNWRETNFPAKIGGLNPARLVLADDGTLVAGIGSLIAWTADDGATWTQGGSLPPGFEVASLALSPNFSSDGVIIAGGTYGRSEIIRSIDGGYTWQTVFDSATVEEIDFGSDISALAISPNFASDGLVVAWMQNAGPLRSTDGGLTWAYLGDEATRFYVPQTLTFAPAGERLYLGALDGHLLVSADGGQTWPIDLGFRIPDNRIWSSAIALDPTGLIYLGTDSGLYHSPDDGQTWLSANNGLPHRPGDGRPESVRALALIEGQLYAALSAGGLFTSADQGQTWRSLSAGGE